MEGLAKLLPGTAAVSPTWLGQVAPQQARALEGGLQSHKQVSVSAMTSLKAAVTSKQSVSTAAQHLPLCAPLGETLMVLIKIPLFGFELTNQT